jgi:hypothetical protein
MTGFRFGKNGNAWGEIPERLQKFPMNSREIPDIWA